MGVNDRAQLAAAEAALQDRLRRRAMAEGATLVAPETVFLSFDAKIGRDVLIEPNVVIGPGVIIEDGAIIRAFSHLEGARVAGGAAVGPFARLRPGADIAANAKIGNFVEIKQAAIERGAKVNHLSYIGDARVGAGANIGAGTITCNYDGFSKHKTDIGAGAFIGSNSALVAPVTIGDGAYVGSGSVITKPRRSRRARGGARPPGGEGGLGEGVPGQAREGVRTSAPRLRLLGFRGRSGAHGGAVGRAERSRPRGRHSESVSSDFNRLRRHFRELSEDLLQSLGTSTGRRRARSRLLSYRAPGKRSKDAHPTGSSNLVFET